MANYMLNMYLYVSKYVWLSEAITAARSASGDEIDLVTLPMTMVNYQKISKPMNTMIFYMHM